MFLHPSLGFKSFDLLSRKLVAQLSLHVLFYKERVQIPTFATIELNYRKRRSHLTCWQAKLMQLVRLSFVSALDPLMDWLIILPVGLCVLTFGDPNSSVPFLYWPLLMMLMGSPWLFFLIYYLIYQKRKLKKECNFIVTIYVSQNCQLIKCALSNYSWTSWVWQYINSVLRNYKRPRHTQRSELCIRCSWNSQWIWTTNGNILS